ncbi:MAG: T9SS C-terminal target domain-containing protein [Candidatus Zixiibacteriota bacterium]|nr:MAG: T9SS C-terminal target domain-containing protein [candidate division Zixibacteria bacterium]
MTSLRAFIPALLLLAVAALALAGDAGPQARRATLAPTVREVPNISVPAADGTDEDSTIFFEDFEMEPTGWTREDLTDVGPQWHPDPFQAWSGNSWWCGDSLWMGYYNLWLQHLVTPTLNLQGTANPTLSFRVRWYMESTTNSPAAPPYNGWDGANVWISTNGGTTWQVISPTSPPYTCTSLSSFGTVWGYGSGVPGWADSSGGWLQASFNLAGYQTSNVKIRWTLASDRAVCSQGHPEITGYFVDDIVVRDGSTILLQNDADGTQVGGPLTFETGPPFGDWWEWTTLDAHSPTHAMRVDDDHFYINDAVISPPIYIPEGYSTKFKYWTRCDLPDSTHGTSTALRDYYFVEASADGEIWDTLFYDYARGGAGYPGWAQFVPGLPYNGDSMMVLTQYAGETIQLRWRVITDGDHTTGNGQGMFLDDVEVYVNDVLDDDAGVTRLHVPFPTVNGFEGTATFGNLGLEPNLFTAFWRTDGSAHIFGTTPMWNLPGQTDTTMSISWTSAPDTVVFVDAYTMLQGDQNHANDTCKAGAVEIFPRGDWTLELGWDARGYSYQPQLLTLHYDQGSGPLVYFETPGFQGFGHVRVRCWETGSFTLHAFDTGTPPLQPGAELGSVAVTVDASEIHPNWKVIDISSIPQLGYTMPEQHFWIWLEMTQASGGPDLVGDYVHFGPGHYFDYNGATLQNSPYEVYVRPLGNDGVGVEPEPPAAAPSRFALEAPRPNPFNPAVRIAFTLPLAGDVTLTACDLSGRTVARLASGAFSAGRHEVTWEAHGLASGIYLLRLESAFGVQVRKAVLVK